LREAYREVNQHPKGKRKLKWENRKRKSNGNLPSRSSSHPAPSELHVKAFEQRCTSPRGVRVIVHRTDVIGGNLAEAQERSNAFVEKYKKQGWGVQVRALTI